MSETRRAGGSKSPVITAEDSTGLKDFYEAYDQNLEAINKQLMVEVARLPDLAAVVKRMSPTQLEEQSRTGHAVMADAILKGNWETLLNRQYAQGAMYASLGVRFHEWMELISSFRKILIPHLLQKFSKDTARLSGALLGMGRYIDISMSSIAEAYLETKEKRIQQQQLAIQELSTPVLQLRERMLLLPIIGVIDTARARLLTQQLLQQVRASRARAVVIDITGVPAVDSKVANHLLQTVEAARLMGATSVITGLSAEVAQALVVLGVDLRGVRAVGDLQGGVEEAERILGYRVSQDGEPRPLAR